MEHEDIQKIVDVRSFLIEKYNKLDGSQQPAAMIKQSDVAKTLQHAIQRIDGLLSGKVNFQ
jgi:hypothetical protein